MVALSTVMTFLVGTEHVYFLWLEMFMWTKPLGMKTFGMNQEQARDTAVLAANQGLYNGFLTAGLYWGLYIGSNAVSMPADAHAGEECPECFICLLRRVRHTY